MQPRDGVRFMAKSDYLEMRIRGRFFYGIGCFPVRRGARDSAAMGIARSLLDAGEPVMVFPEGTRRRERLEIGPPRSGVARLAIETGAPVVPIATWGLKPRALYGRPWWRRPRTVTIFGAPLHYGHLEPTPENVAHVRDEIWSCVERLYDQAREMDSLRGPAAPAPR